MQDLPESPHESIIADMQNLEAYYPYRIIFCAKDADGWFAYAKTTRHTMNRLARQGCPIWELQ